MYNVFQEQIKSKLKKEIIVARHVIYGNHRLKINLNKLNNQYTIWSQKKINLIRQLSEFTTP